MNRRRTATHTGKKVSPAAVMIIIAVLAAGIPFTAVRAAGNRARDITPSDTPKEQKTYIISQDGTGDFTSIQEGADSASDGDTLLIYPGTYTENVRIMGKEINLIGVSRDLCILQYDTAFYRKVPLTIAKGRVAHLTVYGMDSRVEQAGPSEEEIARINEELVGDSWDRQKNYTGYAVHVDQNCLYGKSMRFEDCRIISANNHCVGIGTRGNCSICFEDCELISMGDGSCIYMHDPTSPGVGGEASFVMKSCYMTSYLSPYVMTFQSLLPEYNTTYLTFRDVHVSAVAYADDDGYLPFNVNTGLDVETLSALEKAGALYTAGLSSTVSRLVNEMSPEDAFAYMEEFSAAVKAGDALKVMTTELPEGITCLGSSRQSDSSGAGHHVIAIYNRGNRPGNGWCGLNNAYLTPDSSGNTLVEMNTAVSQHTADSALSPSTGTGH